MKKNVFCPAGKRTPVSRVTGGDTHHYTTEDATTLVLNPILNECSIDNVGFLSPFSANPWSFLGVRTLHNVLS